MSATTIVSPAEVSALLGRVEEAEDVCALPLVRRVAAMLDLDPYGLQAGDPLPRGWHVALFTPLTPQSTLGRDGLPALETEIGGLPRVMMGGRRTRFTGDVPIGANVRRLSRVISVTPKKGRSGRLAVVTTRHDLFIPGTDDAVISEDYDLIFLEAASPDQQPEPGLRYAVPQAAPTCSVGFIPNEALLFRFCAITFNAHRIHYDQPYATSEEGYPALVVNGGLTALLLLQLFRSEAKQEPVAFTARNLRPLFCGRPARLNAERGTSSWRLWAEDDLGRTALEAHGE